MSKLYFVVVFYVLTGFQGLNGQSVLKILEQRSSKIVACDTVSTLKMHLDTLLENHQQRGYLLATYDSIVLDADTAFVYFSRHQLIEITQPVFWDQSRIRKKKVEHTIYSYDLFKLNSRNTLAKFENHGYPFASVGYRVVANKRDQLEVYSEINPGPFIAYDSLIIKSETKQSNVYFRQYLNIRKGQPYSEQDFKEISKRIKELDFVEQLRPAEALFHEEGSDISLYLKSKKSNRFDGIVGFQPDNKTGKIVLTGNVNLGLQNVLHRGEQLNLEWKRLQFQTQDLKVSAALPYILSTKIGLWSDVQLYRRDTTFTTNKIEVAAGLVIGQGKYLRAFTEWYATNPLRDNLINIEKIAIRRYGIAVRGYNIDYAPNPMRGVLAEGQASAGIKTTSETDSSDRKTNQYTGTGAVHVWIPLVPRLSTVLRVAGGTKIDDELRINEQFRIGGLNTLRGFNEESIFASSYAITTAEVKFLLDQSSALFLFYDQAWYERNDDVYFNDRPYGFGAGALIGTGNGSFSIYYALGSEQNNPILLRNGKIHFGFVNRF